jgi:hypothetical protein
MKTPQDKVVIYLVVAAVILIVVYTDSRRHSDRNHVRPPRADRVWRDGRHVTVPDSMRIQRPPTGGRWFSRRFWLHSSHENLHPH